MIKVLITLLITFLIWFGFVKIFGTKNKKSIDVLSNKFVTDFTLIFRNIIDLIDSLFKSFIQIYELLGSSLKNIVLIFKSLTSTLIQFLNLFRIIGITFLSFISLIKALYQATKGINILNKIESAKKNLIKLFKKKNDE